MGQIRRQTILSSISTYFGFLVGALNTYLFVFNGAVSFTADEYGLTSLFINVGSMIYAIASFGVSSIIYKFHPYYAHHLKREDDDLLTWSLVLALIGFVIVVIGGYVFEPLIVRKFSERSALFVVYYRWVFPFGLGYLLFSVIEAYAWAIKQSVLSTVMREVGLRVFVLVLIVPYLAGWISFDLFIKLFTFQYLAVTLVLWLYLTRKGFTHLTFTVSKVTRRFRKKMLSMMSLVYGGIVINMVAQAFDAVLIAGILDLKSVGIYVFLVYTANIIQVPQRSIQAVTIPHLSQAWKDKDFGRINRIYHRTSINMLIFCTALFCLIQLCAADAGHLLGIRQEYQYGLGLNALFILGAARIIDAGTGVNGQIIGTSVYWRFDFFTGVLLLSLRIPLNVYLIKAYGITGSAVADMISLVVYNVVRMIFLARKFGMQPFTYHSALALVFATAFYFFVRWACSPLQGWTGLFAKAILFTALYGGVVVLTRLTPDTAQLWEGIKKKLRPGGVKEV